jgi:hypothetical protein
MDDNFERIDDNFYGYFLFGENLSSFDMNNTKMTLALFNFFGTLVWGEDSYLYNYNKILPCSSLIKENLSILHNKGYTICIAEYVTPDKILKFKNLMNVFYQGLERKVSIFFFIYTKKDVNIYNGLLKFFTPEKQKFGKKSFYCGFQAGKFNNVPWFRYSDKDLQLANSMNFEFYDPIEVLGSYSKPSYIKNTLYIACGPEYSGYEIEYETFRANQKYINIPFKYKKEDCNDIYTDVYGIHIDDLIMYYNSQKLDHGKNKICVKDKAIVIFGLNETKEKRNMIKEYFLNYDLCIIHWYSRFPYKKSKTFNDYKLNFQNPLLHGEFFERMS